MGCNKGAGVESRRKRIKPKMVENLSQGKEKCKIDGGDKRYELTQERELGVNSGAGIHTQRKESMAANANSQCSS